MIYLILIVKQMTSFLAVLNNTEWRNDIEENFNHIAPLAFMYKNHSNSDNISQELRKFYFRNESISENNMKDLGNVSILYDKF